MSHPKGMPGSMEDAANRADLGPDRFDADPALPRQHSGATDHPWLSRNHGLDFSGPSGRHQRANQQRLPPHPIRAEDSRTNKALLRRQYQATIMQHEGAVGVLHPQTGGESLEG